MKWVVHGVRMGVWMGRVRWVRMVVGRVTQRWMVVSLSSSFSSPCSDPFSSLSPLSPLSCQGLVCRRPVGLRDDDVGVWQEGSRAQAVVVHGLRVGLQVALHVLGVEGEVGAQHR